MAEVDIKSGDFQKEVLDSDIPVLIDFWAPWCGACKMVGPVVSEVAKEYEGKLKVCKASVEDAQELASQFGIMSIPTLMLFKSGKPVVQKVGFMPKEELENIIKPYL